MSSQSEPSLCPTHRLRGPSVTRPRPTGIRGQWEETLYTSSSGPSGYKCGASRMKSKVVRSCNEDSGSSDKSSSAGDDRGSALGERRGTSRNVYDRSYAEYRRQRETPVRSRGVVSFAVVDGVVLDPSALRDVNDCSGRASRACRPRQRLLACGRLLSVVAADGAPAANLGVVSGAPILAPYDRGTALVQLGSSTSSAVPLGGTAPPLDRSRSLSR